MKSAPLMTVLLSGVTVNPNGTIHYAVLNVINIINEI